MSDPYVIVGVARTRQGWFSEVARWSTSGAAPVEFLKCLTTDEARALLGSGRRASALLVDAATPGLDRELTADAAAFGVPTVVVSDGRVHRDWESLGCAAVLPAGFERAELLTVLERHTRPVARASRQAARIRLDDEPAPRSRLVGVTGGGGTGSSTVAMCLAQAFGAVQSGHAALIDGCRHADLAMYHDVGDVIPGLPELVEAHRLDHPDPDLIRPLLHGIGHRGYDLLLGMRTPRDWVAMRRHSLAAALGGLARSYDLVVVDHDPDLEGEELTGSAGVEDRHAITRTLARRADLLLVVGRPGLKGTSDLARLLRDLLDEGVPPERLLPVVNRARRDPASRAATTRAIAELVGAELPGALHLPRVRALESAHRSATRLPDAMCRPLGRAVRRLLLELPARPGDAEAPVRVRPGDLHLHDTPPSAWPVDRSDVA